MDKFLGNAEKSNQNKILPTITYAPLYISNFTLHTGLMIKTIHAEAITFYEQFHIIDFLPIPTSLILNLAIPTIPTTENELV